MAKAPAPTGIKGLLANMDQGDKIKLLAASAVLLLAIVWILFYAVLGGSDTPGPSPEDIAKAQAEFEAEAKQLPPPKPLIEKSGRPIPAAGS